MRFSTNLLLGQMAVDYVRNQLHMFGSRLPDELVRWLNFTSYQSQLNLTNSQICYLLSDQLAPIAVSSPDYIRMLILLQKHKKEYDTLRRETIDEALEHFKDVAPPERSGLQFFYMGYKYQQFAQDTLVNCVMMTAVSYFYCLTQELLKKQKRYYANLSFDFFHHSEKIGDHTCLFISEQPINEVAIQLDSHDYNALTEALPDAFAKAAYPVIVDPWQGYATEVGNALFWKLHINAIKRNCGCPAEQVKLSIQRFH